MSSTDFKDYYSTLGVNKTANTAEIKRKFRQLALKYHPDRNQGNKIAESKFKEVSEAYDVLSDPDKRIQYDSYGQHWSQIEPDFSPARNSSRTNASREYNSKVDFDSTDFSQYGNFDEFINELLGRFSPPGNSTSRSTSQAQTPPPSSTPHYGAENYDVGNYGTKTSVAANQEANISLTYAEAFRGTSKNLNLGRETIEVRIPAGARPWFSNPLGRQRQSPQYSGNARRFIP